MSCGQRLLRLGSWKFITSDNRRKILCLQRRIRVVPWKEVNKNVRGDIRAIWGSAKCVHEEEKGGDSYYLRPYPDRDSGTHLSTWCTCYSWRFTSCWVLESQVLQMDISEACPAYRLHSWLFICVATMVLLEWAQVYKKDCRALGARVKSTNAQVVFSSILPVRWKGSGGRGRVPEVRV